MKKVDLYRVFMVDNNIRLIFNRELNKDRIVIVIKENLIFYLVTILFSVLTRIVTWHTFAP